MPNPIAPMSRNSLLQDPTVDNAVAEMFGMQPGMDRLNLLPRRDPRLGWIAPNALYQLARALVSPGVAAHGGYVSPEDAVNFAGNVSLGAYGASRAAPVTGPGKTVGMFAGPKAATADQEMLGVAREMAAKGMDDTEIWRKTGWWLNHPDGVPRFEIPDAQAKVNPKRFEEWRDGVFITKAEDEYPSNVLPHKRLYGAYPEIDDEFTVRRMEYGRRVPEMSGSLNHDSKIISAKGPDKEQARSTLLHELQHAVQMTEDMAKGGSPNSYDWWDVMPEIERIRKQKANLAIDPYAIQNKISFGYHVAADELDKLKAWESLTQKEDELMAARLDPYEAYRRLAGEAEARAVQARRDFTIPQRRATPPWESYDVPLNALIIRR